MVEKRIITKPEIGANPLPGVYPGTRGANPPPTHPAPTVPPPHQKPKQDNKP